MAGKLKDLSGQIFGRLTVVNFSHMVAKHSYWNCVCECGKTHKVRSDCLKNGLVKSCGCLNSEAKVTTHGKSKTKLYHVWASMKDRCNNPNNKRGARYYQPKGITYCKEWESFEPFHEWAISHGYEEGLTLDRINNDGNYEPSNCRWVTMKVQNNNKRQRKTADFYERKV